LFWLPNSICRCCEQESNQKQLIANSRYQHTSETHTPQQTALFRSKQQQTAAEKAQFTRNQPHHQMNVKLKSYITAEPQVSQ
jgi:hypothetical protein